MSQQIRFLHTQKYVRELPLSLFTSVRRKIQQNSIAVLVLLSAVRLKISLRAVLVLLSAVRLNISLSIILVLLSAVKLNISLSIVLVLLSSKSRKSSLSPVLVLLSAVKRKYQHKPLSCATISLDMNISISPFLVLLLAWI